VEYDVVPALVVEEVAVFIALLPPPLEVGVGVRVVPVEKRFDHAVPLYQDVASPPVADTPSS
jgi:hypothetical protein